MHIMVLGGGVIGITTAYYLAREGHQVTVLERQTGPAMETSYANAGQLSLSYASPWAAPGMPLKALRWLFEKHAPLFIRPDGTLFQWQWLLKMLGQCTSRAYDINKTRMVRLSEYSRACLETLRNEINIDYEGRQKGTLHVFRTQQQLLSVSRDIEVLERLNIPCHLIKQENLGDIEPALAMCQKLIGGLHLPYDETGDCYLFTTRLAQHLAQTYNVKFEYQADIQRITVYGHSVDGIMTQNGEKLSADAYIVALGAFSRPLLQGIVDIPVYPVKGYSITAPITEADTAPVSTILDESYKVAITRFDSRIRVGGMAEIAGFDYGLKPERRETLMMVLNDLFPQSCDAPAASFWSGLRPMTPDGTPYVSATSLSNLFLNTGHGTLGWTMACGSGRLLSDIISGKSTEIPAQDYAIKRG